MVYCGKPSGGCHSCRQKKTRCDQAPEGCGQCKRGNRVCPGYRAKNEVVIRDESENVIRKFKAKEARSNAATCSSSSVSSFSADDSATQSDEILEVVQRPSTPLFTVAPRLEECATHFFVSNYVVGDQAGSPGRFDYLSNIYQIDSLGEAVVSGMKAVGYAGYANLVNTPSLLRNAQSEYIKAIRLTNAALRSPHEVKKDSTLMAVMILGFYETVTGSDRRSLAAWTDHVSGASALLKLRGRKQLKTVVGRRFFYQVVNDLGMSCVQRGQPLPDYIVQWAAEVKRLTFISDPVFLVHEAMMSFTNFRADVINKSCSDRRVIINRALELDHTFVSLFENAPTEWNFETIYTQADTEIVFNGCYHIYREYWSVQIWNGMRVIRSLLHEQIRNILLEGIAAKSPIYNWSEDTAQLQQSFDILHQMQGEILASVPQHFGVLPPPDTSSVPGLSPLPRSDSAASNISWTSFRDSGKGDFPVLRPSSAHFMIWPLWVVGGMDIASEKVREYAIRNLKVIGNSMGIQQAMLLAKSIEYTSESLFD